MDSASLCNVQFLPESSLSWVKMPCKSKCPQFLLDGGGGHCGVLSGYFCLPKANKILDVFVDTGEKYSVN